MQIFQCLGEPLRDSEQRNAAFLPHFAAKPLRNTAIVHGMNLVETHWRQRRIRTEEGIFHASDEVSEVCGDPRDGYRVDTQEPVALLQRADPAGWIPAAEERRAETNRIRVIAGSTSKEGS